jgi:hypothetical protein
MKLTDFGLKEDRDEWRGLPLSRAGFRLLAEHVETEKRAVMNAAASGEEREVRFAAGKHEGLVLALRLLSEE